MNRSIKARIHGLAALASVALLGTLFNTSHAHAQATQAKASAAASRLAGFKTLATRALRSDGSGRFTLQLDSPMVSASVFGIAQPGGTAWFGGIKHSQPHRFRAASISSGFASVVGDLRFSHVAVLVAERRAMVPVARVPRALGLAPYASGGVLALEAGINLFVSGTPGRTGLLGQLGRGIGLRGTVRIHGAAPPTVAAALFTAARARQSSRAPSGPIALTITLPRFSPEPFASIRDKRALNVVFDRASLSIRGDGSSLSVSGSHAATITVAGRATRVSGTFKVVRRGRAYEIGITGTAALGRSAPSMLGFRVTSIGIDTALRPGTNLAFGLSAGVRLPTGRTVSGIVSMTVGADRKRRKRIEELTLAITGSLSLRDLRVRLPKANEIRLTNPTIGFNMVRRDGFIGGGLTWRAHRLQTRGVVFASANGRSQRPGVTLFIEMAQTSLKKLVPRLPRTLVDIPLPQAVLIMSTAKMTNVPISDLPSPAKAMMDKISTSTGGTITARDGVSIFTRLSTGPIAAFARRLGVTGDLMLGGSIGGFTGGRPGFSLYADLPKFQLPAAMGSTFLAVRSVKPRFFASMSGAGGTDLSAGIELEAGVRIGRQTPVFDGKIFGSVGAKGSSVNFSGTLKGTWPEPLGLKGIIFEDVVIGLELGASASADITLGGKLRIGGLRYSMQGFLSMQVSPAGGVPVPKAIGINLTGDRLGMLTPFEIMDSFVYAAATGPLAAAIKSRSVRRALARAARFKMAAKVKAVMPIQSLSLRNFQIYFATPGASHPDLPALDGMGIKIKGQVYLGNKLLGSTDSFLKMPDGLKLDVRMSRFAIGPLRLDRSKLLLRVPIPGLSRELPKLEITGGGGVKPFTGSVTVGLGLKQVTFAAKVNVGPLGSASFEARSIGSNILAPRDFVLSARFRGFDKGFRKALGGALDAYVNNGPAQKTLRKQKKKVKKKRKALARVMAAARKNRRRATGNLHKAQRKVDRINGGIRSMVNRRNGYNRKLKKAAVWNKPKWASKVTWANSKIAALYVSLKTATGALNVAKASVKIAPLHTSPKVLAAQSGYDTAVRNRNLLALTAAAERGMGTLARTLMRKATRDFRLEKIELRNVRLAGMTRGRAQTMHVQFLLKGKRIRHTFKLAMNGKWKLNFGKLPKTLVAMFE